MIAYTSLHIYI